MIGILGLAAPADAAAPEFLFRVPSDGVAGSGAGRVKNSRDLAGSAVNGHVYVTDLGNSRIDEFTAWGLFVKSWGWGVLDGSPERQTCGPPAPSAEPQASLCRAGIGGNGKGQVSNPLGVTVDAAGAVYVFELGNLRVQKFSPTGQFLLMFGGEVNKTKVTEGAPLAQQNVCPVDPGDVCGAGTSGTTPSHFAGTIGNYIAYSSPANAIVVGDKDGVQIFNLDGSFREEIPFEGELSAFAGKSVTALDVDSGGNIYLIVEGLQDVYKLSPAGVPLDPGNPGSSKFEVEHPEGAVAVDTSGDVYAVNDSPGDFLEDQANVFGFDSVGNKLFPTQEEEEGLEVLEETEASPLLIEGEERDPLFPYLPTHSPGLHGLATNLCAGGESPGSLYLVSLSYFEGYGTPPLACEPPPPASPEITSQYAVTVKTESATLRAQINPHFWPDATYYLEYGTGRCLEGGCGSKEPLPPGTSLTSKSLSKAITTAGISLAGLLPGTTYHYRFVAQSGGGGPAFGVDPDGAGPEEASFEDGGENTFTTFPLATANPPCGNEEFRSGVGGKLPDCRAYELVSPLDKSNGDAALLPPTKAFFELNQSSTSGDRFTYASITPFAEPESAPFISQYLANRNPGAGWGSASISPPRSTRSLEVLRSLNNEFKAFSPDLCTAWLRHNSVSTLAQGAIPGYPNLYRRENCSKPASYEALSTSKPPTRSAQEYEVDVMGFADEDPTKAIFMADDALTPDAPALPEVPQRELQLYEHTASGLHFICYLPSGIPYGFACAAGIAAGQPDGHASAVQNAISADGSRVFWTAYKGSLGVAPEGIPGNIYLRLNPDKEEGECSEPEKACTIAVSGSVSPEPAQYWGASDDGSKAIFAVVEGPLKGSLYEFDVDTETSRLIAEGVEGPMGMSEDASRIYLSSSKVLGDSESKGAKEGAHNLYLYEAPKAEGEEGRFKFIMLLAGRDLLGSEPQPGTISEVPSKRSASVSADGLHAAFTSAAAPTPTGYDNLDAVSGKADQEDYLYDAKAEKLRCVSCNPTGARPAGANINNPTIQIWAAARLPNRRAPLNPPHPLSQDGKRLFFESHEGLVPGDGNGTWDVYQWEAAGTGSCDAADSTFNPQTGGCVDLISSGDSTAESRLLDADADGSDVFIGTQSSLIPTDFGSNDVYDARIGGGFPLPSVKAPCEGEACQNPPGPAAKVTPSSAVFEGKGNARRSRHCKRGTHKVRRHGKSRCVRKHKGHGRHAGHRRRAAL